MSSTTKVTREQAIEMMQEAFGAFAGAIYACRQAGLEPVEAFAAVGIEVPAFAAPLLNAQLNSLVPQD